MTEERLQKLLARAGVSSRRAAEQLIRAGRVRLDGRIVRELGTKADPRKNKIEVDGRRLGSERRVYYLLHKPRACVTTLEDPEGRPTVAELLRHVPERVFPVGRLDFHTTGALLLTNDGELTNALLHPRGGIPRTYVVKVSGTVTPESVEALKGGVPIGPGQRARAHEATLLRRERGSSWVRVTLKEGRNRQIHRMFDAVGHRVSRLSRTHFANLTADGLRPGDYRPLTQDELKKLKRLLPKSMPSSGARTTPSRGGGRGEARRPQPSGKPAKKRPAKNERATESGPAKRGPTKGGPTERTATKRGPTKRGPTKRGPTKRGPTKRTATKRGPTKRTTAKRGPTKRKAAKRTKRGR